MTDSDGNETDYEYDRVGRLSSIWAPNYDTVTFAYDKGGRLIEKWLPNGITTRYAYNADNSLSQVVNRAGASTIISQHNYTYDGVGNPASDVVTPQMTYAYDDFGRKLKEIDPLGKFSTFTYNANNNVTTMTDAKGQQTGYTWGYGHQMLTRTNTAGNVTYTRNALGQVLKAQSPEVTYDYTYDVTHRLASVTDSRGGKKLSYTYSPGGLLNDITDSDGNETDYEYDRVGRLSSIWASNYDTVTFAYDKGGRLIEKWLPNGITTRYAYNADNSLSQVVNRTNSSTIISQHNYTYDGVGNRNSHTEKISTITTGYSYLYDELNRLTQVGNGNAAQQENYAYDPLNNRTSKTVNATTPVVTAYIYDAANQLKEIRQDSSNGALLASMLYDDNGSMASKSEGATTTTLNYDALNRLTQVTKTGISTQAYSYDDQGRRIAKTVGGATTNYLYNGPDIYGEYTNWATPTALYTHGPNTDDPIIRATATMILPAKSGHPVERVRI